MTLTALEQLLANVPAEVVADVEHLPNAEPGLAPLLGVALCWPGSTGFYIPINHWVGSPSTRLETVCERSVVDRLRLLLSTATLNGWNIEHDREWIDAAFGITSKWNLDGRILWYLTDTKQTERGYGLKKAQVTILGWPEAGDAELRLSVSARGGSVDDGDHYLADCAVLGRYATDDALSTCCVIEQLRTTPDIQKHHDLNRDYATFLARTTRRGVLVDENALWEAKRFYEAEVAKATERIGEVCAPEIATLESQFLTKRLSGYKTEKGKSALLAAPSRHPRFNPNSSQQRSKLLHDIVGLPVVERTATGKPKSDKKTIAAFDHPSAQAFVELSTNEKLLQMSTQYFQAAKYGTIHFPHDTVSTVSERLGGHVPYDLNMPFGSEHIMRAFRVRPGLLGIHMDLVSIEPCLIAGFSGDETMLKVYRDGLGDIYLDLCLDLFPLEEADQYEASISRTIHTFHREYDTNAPPSTEQKEKFGKIRKLAKIIQLAVGYTGTKYTVSKNLTQAGFPTSLDKADLMVYRYWQRLAKVAILAGKLRSLASQRGFINGLFGRKLYIPRTQTKDALNRFGQHGGHAILRHIVFYLNQHAAQLDMHPLLPDIHDSTSWELPEERYADGVRLFEDGIRDVNTALCLPVHVRGEIKQFRTFYGLKNKED